MTKPGTRTPRLMGVQRIIRATTLLAAFLAVGIGLSLWQDSQPLQAGGDTWIPLPADGMDATQQPIRELIMRRGAWPDRVDVLAWRCGRGSPGEPREEYITNIGDPMLEEGAQAWEVTMIPRGSQMEVRIADGHDLPPPPPPPPPPKRVTLGHRAAIVDVHWVELSSLLEIRNAWAARPLWLAAQENVQCADGRPVLMEACVEGKYIARFRNCAGDADAAAARLWRLLQRKFPPPQPVGS